MLRGMFQRLKLGSSRQDGEQIKMAECGITNPKKVSSMVKKLVKLIKSGNIEKAYKLLDKIRGIDISCRSIHVPSPVTVCIQCGQHQFLEALLKSSCIINPRDLQSSILKLMHNRDLAEDTRLRFLKLLIQYGAIPGYFNFFGEFFRLSFTSQYDTMERLMQVFAEAGDNYQKGLLVWVLYEERYYASREHWKNLVYPFIKQIHLRGFNPKEFLSGYATSKSNFSSFVALQHMLQLTGTIPSSILNELMHKLFCPAEFDLRQFFMVLISLNYSKGKSVIVKRENGEFRTDLNFNSRVLSLSEWCRNQIRDSLTEPNVLLGVKGLDVPCKIKRYLLMEDILSKELVEVLLEV